MNPKFGVWMHLWMTECRIPFGVTVTLALTCVCIFGWGSVTYHFRVTVTFDLISRIIVSGAYLLYYFKLESQIGVWMHLGIVECRIPWSGHCELDLDL